MIQNKVEAVQETAEKIQCAECGQWMEIQVESYLMECDRCLAKRDE
jgi:Zn finger protein HypA/HybF involved in hydrogenase expression